MSAADREAFLREMGITGDDIASPDDVIAERENRVHHRQETNAQQRMAAGTSAAEVRRLEAERLAAIEAELEAANQRKARPAPPSRNRPVDTAPSASASASAPAPAAAAAAAPARVRTSPLGDQNASAEDLKSLGNELFEAGRFPEATVYYTAAIDKIQSAKAGQRAGPSGGDGSHHLLSVLFSNRSASHVQTAVQQQAPKAAPAAEGNTLYDMALLDAENAISLRPDWFKGHARQGDVHFVLGQYGQAAEAYEMALQLDAGNESLIRSLKESREAVRAAARQRAKESAERTTLSDASRFKVPAHPAVSSSVLQNPPPAQNDNREDAPLNRTYPAPNQDIAAAILSSNVAPPLPPGRKLHGTYSGTDVKDEWNLFKTDMETDTRSSTAEAYRKRQLEEFRSKQRTGESSLTVDPSNNTSASLSRVDAAPAAKGGAKASSRRGGNEVNSTIQSISTIESGDADRARPSAAPQPAQPPRHLSEMTIPIQYSSQAAAAYQQKLLDEYRRRKAAGVAQ